MNVMRINWAGLVIESEASRIMIDPVYYFDKSLFGEPKDPFLPLSNELPIDAILLTHLHSDHFDPRGIIETYGTAMALFVPKAEVSKAKAKGFVNVTGMDPGEDATVGSLKISAVQAVDGLGDPQVSWVVKDKKHTIFHGGDTLWHGFWWAIARNHGPFDVAVLTINEAVVQDEGMMPSGMPITMSPEQAVAAANILTANTLVPIHYHSFMNPPRYVEGMNLVERLETAAELRGLHVQIVGVKEEVIVDQIDAGS